MQALERHFSSQDWITIIFIACLFLLVIAKNQYPKRFQEFSSLLTSSKFIAFKGKENKAFHGFNIIMFIIQALSVSLFIFIIYPYFLPASKSPILLFIRIFTAYSCFILLKFGVEKIIGNIFNLDSKIDYYLFQKFTYRNFIGIFLLITTLFLVYTFQPNLLFLYIIAGIALAANAIALFNIFKKNQNLLTANWFYFILYLCALEIAPYIILYKLITI